MNRQERISILLDARNEASSEIFNYSLFCDAAEEEYNKTKNDKNLESYSYFLGMETEWRENHKQIEKELTKATHKKTFFEWIRRDNPWNSRMTNFNNTFPK